MTKNNSWYDLAWYDLKTHKWVWHESWVSPDSLSDLKEDKVDDKSR